MAISLSLQTPSGLATYHMVGVQVYPDFPDKAYCFLLSYTDQNARLTHADPLMTTRFEMATWRPQVDPLNMDGASPDPTGKIAFYDYIATIAPWSAGVPVLDVDPEPTDDPDADG